MQSHWIEWLADSKSNFWLSGYGVKEDQQGVKDKSILEIFHPKE